MEHNILLVDDDPGLIRVMASMLAGLGQFRFATAGESALHQARDWQPDLMVLDAELPGLSGFQICETIKADPSLRDVPIIFVTSHCDHDFEVKGLEIGCGRLHCQACQRSAGAGAGENPVAHQATDRRFAAQCHQRPGHPLAQPAELRRNPQQRMGPQLAIGQ